MRCTTVGFLVLGVLFIALATEAQSPAKVYRIGVLSPFAQPAEPPIILNAVRQVLRERNWIEGQHFTFERRYAEGQYDRLPMLAAELVQLPVDVLLAVSTSGAQAAQRATRTIPIVFVGVSDPVGSGVVASLAQPGANVTGVALTPTWDIIGKRLQLLREAVPQMSRVAFLWNPTNPANPFTLTAAENAAQALGVPLHPLAVRDPTELEQAFHAITDTQANGLYISGDPMLDAQHRRIAQFALEHRVPTMFYKRALMEGGGLMSYGPVDAERFRRSAILVDKILRGAKPADLPVEQPMQFELVINLKTAQALGLTLPPTFLFQADEVIR
jgi:ABC-type uncharacterized transport system substrate-binding protein